MLLITGCGRSGTHYSSALFKHLGLDLPHESVGRDGTRRYGYTQLEAFAVPRAG
jgi:hypothetical protein